MSGVLPGLSKRALRRKLYEFRILLSYRKATQIIRGALEDDDSKFVGVSAAQVLLIKRALESHRKTESVVSPEAAEAEIALLERAAEMGDRAAVALLVGARLSSPQVTPEDWKDGSNLLKQLMDAKFPLSFKVSGDLAYQMGKPVEASEFYLRALDSGISDNKLRTECLRNLGHIYFRQGSLFSARKYFALACQGAEDLSQVADCHFFLAQLREADREAARVHLELAATSGLSDSFVPLGQLLLNYFGKPRLASNWFQLGLVTDKTGQAALGLLDAAVRMENTALALQTVGRIRRMENGEQLLQGRADTVSKLMNAGARTGPGLEAQAPPTLKNGPTPVASSANAVSNGRWEF